MATGKNQQLNNIKNLGIPWGAEMERAKEAVNVAKAILVQGELIQ